MSVKWASGPYALLCYLTPDEAKRILVNCPFQVFSSRFTLRRSNLAVNKSWLGTLVSLASDPDQLKELGSWEAEP